MRRNSRGRLLEFGRLAQLTALTLPEDVVEWLTNRAFLAPEGERGTRRSKSTGRPV